MKGKFYVAPNQANHGETLCIMTRGRVIATTPGATEADILWADEIVSGLSMLEDMGVLHDQQDEEIATLFDEAQRKRAELYAKIELVKTCDACPEQYDAMLDGKTVAYLRLRHGRFYVECPDTGGKRVYEANDVRGDGIFEDDERDRYLGAAKTAIVDWFRQNRK